MKPDETIDLNVKSLWHAISRMYNEEAGHYGSTMATANVLLNIDMEHGTPSTSLGPKMGMETTSLSRTLRSMEEKGLIYRKPNPNDGRGVLICLTEFGVENRQISREKVYFFNEIVRSRIPNGKIRTFLEVAQEITTMITEKEFQFPVHESKNK
jgi:DNA-binding MarR family transcriptional regulator